MSKHETTQQAIESYLAALLSDEEDLPEAETLQPTKEESWQERQLKSSMLQATTANTLAENSFSPSLSNQAQAEESKPNLALDEPLTANQVILPNLNLATKPKTNTLAEVVQQLEKESQQEVLEPEILEQEALEPETIEPETLEQEAFAEEILVAASVPVEKEAVAEKQITTSEPDLTQATEKTPDAGQPPTPPGWKDGRPVWAQERFECLLFKVKGLTLAVPLVELGGIIKIEQEPTPLFGQPSWYLGMLRNNNMNVSMVDTAQWVMPATLAAKHSKNYELVIRLHNSNWGLACNQVDRSISLEPAQVRWRTSLGTRPWLAGTVIEHMCALIDPAAFARLLHEGHGDMKPANLTQLEEMA